MADTNGNGIGAGTPDFATLAALDLPVLVIDSGTMVLYQNPAAIAHVGWSPERSVLAARIRSPAILDMVTRTLDDRQTRTVEHIERVPSERWYEVRVAAVPGQGNLFAVSFRDLTEARRMDRMRSDFVANASHELRTPLASLMGFVETMQGPAKDDDKARERFLAIMLDQASRMSRLIDDLLSLSRLEMRAHVPPQGSVDISVLAAHVADSLKPMASEVGVVISLDLPEIPVLVTGDQDELIQVLENLIANGVKYGQSGGRVEVVVGADTGEGVTVAVRDHGPGISREHLPRLTERFYRVDVESSRTKKGTGLGLAIVKHILTRHRARLTVRSEPGEGATFTVRFGREQFPNSSY